MKRITTFLFLLLFALTLQGQTVLRAYNANEPLNINTTCEAWLDGKDASTFDLNGVNVITWSDKSGNGRDVTQAVDGQRPSYDVSTGRVSFVAGNSDFLQSTAFASALTQPNTVFIVANLAAGGGAIQVIFSGAVAGNLNNFLMISGNFSLYAGTILADGARNANDNIKVGCFNGANSEYWHNGVSVASGAAGSQALDGISLGKQQSGINYADCDIMEVIIYNAAISAVDRDRITGYLSNKWVITTTTTYKGDIIRAYDANQPLHIEDECKVWLDGKDAGQFTLDGTYVDDWIGKGSLGVHAANANDNTTRPTYDINTGRVTFIAANQTFLQSAAFGAVLTQPNTVFIAYKITGNIAITMYFFDGTTSDVQPFVITTSLFKIYAGVPLEGGATNANDNIHVGLFNGVSSEYWINGVSKSSGNIGASNLDGITLGKRGSGAGNFSDVEIMEVIIYNADISDVDRDKITGYLANKWDITATTDFKGYVLYEMMWLILLLILNIRRKENEYKIAA